MVYLEDFDEFQSAAQELFAKNSGHRQVRYQVKYRHCDGKVVLKVTDDRVCLKYKTDQLTDMRRIERLTVLFMRWTTFKDVQKADQLPTELEESGEAAAAAGGRAQKKKKRRG
ncbi:unnamed protein product [Vitrella brassicaformis CCMP3155]|uniref:SRP9 domain-containing protein n=1 Tax=Vitrella brassicaformis (strain CCMP3155) TaxID=1169540 RepID=A0A0G4EHE8_VITBC|nr:unnamed protein product [Vitrella brassicaformis CCMP3155]|mmetsp:Transcript_25779/g.63948  ORF Transcript_25779/g.63948 Transcript_25779/m.63948 type:complete len:113 (-) Transcript_25779:1516-1854(-)|eukprot:CEL95450.1 unnamed protein product [Vitrella brassicaformis CCMP3155]